MALPVVNPSYNPSASVTKKSIANSSGPGQSTPGGGGGGGGGGTGNVVGPAGATNNDLVLFDGATGELIKDAGIGLSGVIKSGDAAGGNLSGTYPNPTVKQVQDQAGVNFNITPLGSTANTLIGITGANLIGIVPGPSSLPPSGAAGGNLSGNYPNPTVRQVQDQALVNYNITPLGSTVGSFIGITGANLIGIVPGPASNNFNVLAYGAIPNSTSAASANVTAWNNAVAACIANGGGSVYWPGLGTYYINAVLAATVGTTSVTTFSDGKGAAVIMQTAANTGCFAWTKTDSRSILQMINLVFNQNSGTAVSSQEAVSCTMSGGGPQSNIPGFSCINCSVSPNFSPSSVNPGTFTHGFATYGLTGCYFTLCDYSGTGTAGSRAGTGFYFGSVGSQSEFNLVVDKCIITNAQVGVAAPTAGSGNNPQTVIVTNSQITGCDFDVQLGNTTQLVLQGNDLQSAIACLSCGCTWSGFTPTSSNSDATFQSQIVGNLFYVGDGSSATGAFGICGVIHDTAIGSNTFVSLPGSGSPSQTMLRLMGDSQDIAITGNCFQAGGSVGAVLFDSGTANCHTLGNPSLGATFVDNGTAGTNTIGTAFH